MNTQKALGLLAAAVLVAFTAAPAAAQTLIRGTLYSFAGSVQTDEVGHQYTRFTIRDLNGNNPGYYFREYENFMGWVENNYQPGDQLAITGTIMTTIGGTAQFMIPSNINLKRGGVIAATVHSTPASTPFYSQCSHLSWPGALKIRVDCEYSPTPYPVACPGYPTTPSIPFSQWCSILSASPVDPPFTAAHGRLLDISVGCP